MITESIRLTDREGVSLDSYIHSPYAELQIGKRRAVIICPGGGYTFLSEREGEPVAAQFFAAGFNVFVLRYSLSNHDPAHAFDAAIEISLAVRYLRENSDRLMVDADHIYTMGFSAGGHLAASAGTLWKHPKVLAAMGDAPYGINKPTGMILCYPVITADPRYAHKGSIDNVTGTTDEADPIRTELSIENTVDDDTCPAFIWHTFNDDKVPVRNSLLLADALEKHRVPFEMHIYPNGPHGLSLANEETCAQRPGFDTSDVATWLAMAIRWAKR